MSIIQLYGGLAKSTALHPILEYMEGLEATMFQQFTQAESTSNKIIYFVSA